MKQLWDNHLDFCFVTTLIEDTYFLQWMRLSQHTSLHVWFNSLLRFSRTIEGALRVDKWCRTIMSHYLQVMVQAIKTRRKREYTSFETDMFPFLHSDKFTQISKESLPVQLAKNHPGCVVLAMCLNRVMATKKKEMLYLLH